jgi:hypothetical protein
VLLLLLEVDFLLLCNQDVLVSLVERSGVVDGDLLAKLLLSW